MQTKNTKTREEAEEHPIFNNEYRIETLLGQGSTARVYLCRSLKDPTKEVALKLLKNDYIERAGELLEKEITIHQGLQHHNITKIIGHGKDGQIKKSSGKKLKNLYYILLENIPCGHLLDMSQECGAMGEDYGRFFFSQILDCLEYLHSNNVAHRDIKLENILVDEEINLKVTDFGFASKKEEIDKLKSYRGTRTYMAPEVRAGETYDGRKADIFSSGVILFIMVHGIFPFKEAKKDDYFYNLVLKGKHDKYWNKMEGQDLSDEFKDLII